MGNSILNKNNIDVTDLKNMGYTGNLDSFTDQSMVDNLSMMQPKQSINSYTEYANSPGMFGLSNGAWNNMGQLSGLAGTAFNVYDNLFGNKADMYKTQMSAMKQNMANIAEDRANRKAFVGNIGNGFNKALGSGLAASGSTVKL